MKPSNALFDWNDARVELLIQRMREGLSFRKISVELGCNRNQCIGKTTRLRIAGRAPSNQQSKSQINALKGSHASGLKPGTMLRGWTDQETETLRTLYPTRTMEAIGELLGRSARGVESKCRSLGLRKSAAPSSWAKPRNPRPSVRRPRLDADRAASERAAAAFREKLFAEEVDVHEGVSLADLGDHHCKWPLGDPKQPTFAYCGHARAPGKPYCASHAKRAFESIASFKQRNAYSLTYQSPNQRSFQA